MHRIASAAGGWSESKSDLSFIILSISISIDCEKGTVYLRQRSVLLQTISIMATDAYTSLSALGTLLLGLGVTVILVCGYTYLTTLTRFQINARKHPNSSAKAQLAHSPPLVPHFIPGLGSTITFSNQNIGAYWKWLQSQAARYRQDAFAIVLAGVHTNFIFSEAGISAVFKSRQLSREKLDQQLGMNVLGMSKEDSVKAFPYDVAEKEKSSEGLVFRSSDLISYYGSSLSLSHAAWIRFYADQYASAGNHTIVHGAYRATIYMYLANTTQTPSTIPTRTCLNSPGA